MKTKSLHSQNQNRLDYLSTFVREHRCNEGMTQVELSKQMNVSRNTIIRAEKRKITLDYIFEFADTMGLTLQDVFSDVD